MEGWAGRPTDSRVLVGEGEVVGGSGAGSVRVECGSERDWRTGGGMSLG